MGGGSRRAREASTSSAAATSSGVTADCPGGVVYRLPLLTQVQTYRCAALSVAKGHNRSSVLFNVNFGFVRWLDRQNELEQRPALAVR
jgi:hypothetical protein